MYIFERLISKDCNCAYYVMKNAVNNSFYFFTQDEGALDRIRDAANPIDEMLEIYVSLTKTRRERIENKDFENTMPARSHFYCFEYKEVMAQVERRRQEGKKSQIRLSK